jgi:glycosyltransferase involved in cell wall biosynthesis
VTPDLVSTIIPVFNRATMLRKAVASVLRQTWRPIEIIIVDDGSDDDTLLVASELASNYPGVVRVLSQSNAGPGVARQMGLQAARGEFIQFLDSDDLLLPQKFAVQVAGLRADEEAGISYGKTFVREHGSRRAEPSQRSAEQHRSIFPALLIGRLWETSTTLYRRSALEHIGPWPAKRQMEDWEFDAQAGAAGIKLQYCYEWLSEYTIHDEPRLANAWMRDDAAFIDMVSAHLSILRHAQTAGVGIGSEHMDQFARTLFRLSRMCAARGLGPLATRVLEAAATAAKRRSKTAVELRLFAIASRVCGWRAIGRLCAWRDRPVGRAAANSL